MNLPIGLLAWMLAYRFSSSSTAIEKRRIDLPGFARMSIGLRALQIVLDQNNPISGLSDQEIATVASSASISKTYPKKPS